MVKLPEKEKGLEIALCNENENCDHSQEYPKSQEYYQYWEHNEELGELPSNYEEDKVVLLTLHCTAAYVYWDFSPPTLQKAFDWMPQAITKVRIWQGDQIVQESNCSLSDSCWYFHGLSADRTYRAEVIAASLDGQIRRIGPISNPTHTPAACPSNNRDDRFVRAFISIPSQQLAEFIRRKQIPISQQEDCSEPFCDMSTESTRFEPLRRNQPRNGLLTTNLQEVIFSILQSEISLASPNINNSHNHELTQLTWPAEHLVPCLEMNPFPDYYRERLFEFSTSGFFQDSSTSSEEKPKEYSLTEENN